MEIIKVGIYFTDKAFAQAMAKGLSRECRTMIFIIMDCFEDGRDCQMILSTRELKDSRVVFMTTDVQDIEFYQGPPYKVFLYKESNRLITDLLFIYFKMTGNVIEYRGNSKCNIVVAAGQAGGLGTTSIAINTGKMLNRFYGYKCIYINLCPINDSSRYLGDGEKSDLLKLFYFLDKEKDFPIETFINQGEDIDYIGGEIFNTYFNEITPKILNKLLEKIDKLGIYTYLLIDIGNHFSRENKRILKSGHRVLFVKGFLENKDECSLKEIEEQVLDWTLGSDIVNIYNFVKDDWPINEGNHMYVSFQSDFSLDKNYGIEIGSIAKALAEGDKDE